MKSNKIFFIFFTLFVLLPVVAFGAVDTPQKVIDTITLLSGWMYSILIAVAILFIIISAFTFLTASGDENKITKAKNQLLYAVIAVSVAILATGVIKILEELLL